MKKDIEENNDTPSMDSFNSAIEHSNTIMGHPKKSASLKEMPRFVRWFYYFVLVVILGGSAFLIVALSMK